MHMRDGSFCLRRIMVENVGSSAIGHDCIIQCSPSKFKGKKTGGEVTLFVHGQVQLPDCPIRAKYLFKMTLVYVLGQLLHNDL